MRGAPCWDLGSSLLSLMSALHLQLLALLSGRFSEPTSLPCSPGRLQSHSGVTYREKRKRLGPSTHAQWEGQQRREDPEHRPQSSLPPCIAISRSVLSPTATGGPKRWQRAGQVTLLALLQPVPSRPPQLLAFPVRDVPGAKNTSGGACEPSRSPLVALFCGLGWERTGAHALSHWRQVPQMLGEAEIKLGACSRIWVLW